MKLLRFAVALLSVALAQGAQAQAYPDKPVRVIVSFTPGSSTDIVGRVVMAKVSEYWGQPVVVENRGGAGGSIGSREVATSAPDGYTLLINSNAHTVNPAIYAKLPYDTLKDFTDIAPLAAQPNVLVVNATSPHKTVAEFVAAAKAKPGSVNIGHAGIGSGTHLSTERFIAATGVKVEEVPFKGTPEVLAALLSNSVQAYFAPISAGLSAIKGGKLRALAVTTDKRNPTLPDVPTLSEAGVRNASSALWFGVWGPAGMQPAVAQKISADVRRALAEPGVKEKLHALGNDTMDMSMADFGKFVREEIQTYAAVIKAAGIKPQ
jgi:tripartite-type tricarboxylate transporter receptor subunit TctC